MPGGDWHVMTVHTPAVRGSAGTGLLLERERELEVVGAAIQAAAAGTGGVLLIAGAPGIGKSRLVASARGRARELGMQVLEARGAVLEREFAFGVARQLFEPAVMALGAPDREALFDGAARLAATLLGEGGSAPARERGDTAFGALHGLYWLTVNLADRGPLLLSVDDAHWADPSSLRFLSYLSRRLEGLPVLLIAAGRGSDPEAGDEFNRLAEDPVASVIRLLPLSDAAVAACVRERLGDRADAGFCNACHRATHGNPLFVRELVAALAEAEVAPTAESVAAVTEVGPPVVGRFVLHRLERLGPDATALARAVAVLGGDADLALAARVAAIDDARARAAADLLVRADVFASDQSLRFVHPIVQTAVYDDLLPGERSAQHVAVARLLQDRGAPAERVAAHLLEVGSIGEDDWVQVLRQAATDAAARGDPAAAVGYLRRALNESLSAETRAEMLGALGRWELSMQQYESSHDHLLAALEGPAPERVRRWAAVWLARSAMIWGRPRATTAAFEAIAAELQGAEGDGALVLEAEVLNLVRLELTLRHLVPERLAQFQRNAAGNPRFESIARIHAASEQLLAGMPAAQTAQEVEAVLSSGQLTDAFALAIAVEMLIATEQYSSAGRWVGLALEAARALGLGTEVAIRHTQRGLLALWRGAVGDAQLDAQTAIAVAGIGHFYAPRMVALAVQTAVERGELDVAQELVAQGGESLASERVFGDEFLTARGNLRIAQGELHDGLADLLRCGELLAAYRSARPTDWRSGAVHALSELGDQARAQELAREGLAAARRFGAPRALARALRSAGTAIGGDEGMSLLEEAVTVVDHTPARLEAAYAYADLGAELVRRRRRREGREVLQLAIDGAAKCGATALAQRVRGDLGAGGGRPSRRELSGVDALTPAERRVCDLAAGELSNREVAQRLFVTEKTVELHLTSAYRKLGIRSRFQLASVIPAPVVAE